jgi:hypothetical protein
MVGLDLVANATAINYKTAATDYSGLVFILWKS